MSRRQEPTADALPIVHPDGAQNLSASFVSDRFLPCRHPATRKHACREPAARQTETSTLCAFAGQPAASRAHVDLICCPPRLLTSCSAPVYNYAAAAARASSIPSQSSPVQNVVIGSETVQLHTNDTHFAKLRAYDQISLEDVGPEQFSFAELASGGGKGGNPMQATRDRRLIVKQLSADNHAELSAIASMLVERVTSAESMLMRIYWHFFRPSDKTFYVVMKNLLPREFAEHDTDCALFDLKGCRDDKMMLDCGKKVPQVHKRFYNLPWLLAEAVGLEKCVAAERGTYRRGKARAFIETFTLAPEDRQLVTSIAAADADFLAAAGLMDYSLLVGTLTKRMLPNGALPDFPQGGAIRPLIQITATPQGPVVTALYLGIIDYLQGWTTGKRVAHVIKEIFAPHPISTVKPRAYCIQFKEANNRRFSAGTAESGPRLITARASGSVPVASGEQSHSRDV